VGDQLKTIGFAVVVCLVCSILLAVVSSVLAPMQEMNKANDIKIKVLEVLGVKIRDASGRLTLSQKELDALFNKEVKGLVLNSAGEVVPGKEVSSLTEDQISKPEKATGLKEYYPLYIYTNPDGKIIYAIHISGKGLWSTIKGYLALEDLVSPSGKKMQDITGITFYEQKETPGLGGDIVKPFFTSRFVGKSMFDGTVQPLEIVKAGEPTPGNSTVDGITGATLTCNGVQKLINTDYSVYNHYFETLRKDNGKGMKN